MADVKQIFTFLEPDQGFLDGKSCNPWADAAFNFCNLEPQPDDFGEKVGIEGATTIERVETVVDKGGSCYWVKIGADIYYNKGDVLIGTSVSPGDGRVTIQKPGNLGFNLDMLELINSATGLNIIGTATSIAWYAHHEDTTNKDGRIMARITAAIESNWASVTWSMFDEVDWYGSGVGTCDDCMSNAYEYPGVCSDGTYLYIIDQDNDRIVKRSLWGYAVVGVFGTLGSGNGQFDYPSGICTDGFYLYIVDLENSRIKVHKCEDLSYVRQFGTLGTGDNNFNHPRGICIAGGYLFITDTANARIKKHSTDGTFVQTIGTYGTGNDQFGSPYAICTDGTYVYIMDGQPVTNRIKKHKCSDLSYVAKASTVLYQWLTCVGSYLFGGSISAAGQYETIALGEVDTWAGNFGAGGCYVYPYFIVSYYTTDAGLLKRNGVLVGPGAITTENAFNSCLDFSTTRQAVSQPWVRITSLGYMGIGTLNPAYRLDVDGSANVDQNCYVGLKSFIGAEDTNTNLTIGLTINVATNEDQALAFKGTGLVDHGMTALVETDTFADMRVNADNGGIEINGYTAGTIGVALYGFYTTGNTVLTTAGFGAVTMYAAKKSGTTWGPCASTDNVFCVRPYITGPAWSSVFIVNASGNAWLPGKIQANQLQSDVAIGTAPLVVTSTTVVANLNADLLDGSHASAFAAAAHAHALDDLSDVNAGAPNDNDVLSWDAASSKWIAVIPAGGGAFLDLTDVDEADYVGHEGDFVKVNAAADGLEFGAGGAGASAFLDLTDVTEADYVGHGGQYVRVNGGETGLEFVTLAGGGTVLGSGVNTRVAFWTAADTIDDDANFTWDGSILLVNRAIAIGEIATPAAAAGYGKIYTKSDNALYFLDDGGFEYDLLSSGFLDNFADASVHWGWTQHAGGGSISESGSVITLTIAQDTNCRLWNAVNGAVSLFTGIPSYPCEIICKINSFTVNNGIYTGLLFGWALNQTNPYGYRFSHGKTAGGAAQGIVVHKLTGSTGSIAYDVIASTTLPIWLKIQVNGGNAYGNTITFWYSTDGSSWTQYISTGTALTSVTDYFSASYGEMMAGIYAANSSDPDDSAAVVPFEYFQIKPSRGPR